MWQQMTKKTLDQIETQQRHAIKTKACSTYAESFTLPGFEVKELGSEIDEEVNLSKNLLLTLQTATKVINLFTVAYLDLYFLEVGGGLSLEIG